MGKYNKKNLIECEQCKKKFDKDEMIEKENIYTIKNGIVVFECPSCGQSMMINK